MQSLLGRYDILYSSDSPVILEKTSFVQGKVCMGLKARQTIPAGCPILSTSTSLSKDVVPEDRGGISVIEGSRGQKGPMGPRLMLGPLRFANHDCKPNCQVGVKLYCLGGIAAYRLDPGRERVICIHAMVPPGH